MTAVPPTARPSDPAPHPVHALGGSVTPDDFKAVFRGHPGGVAVITAEGPDGPVALTATSVSSVSVDPPLLVFSVTAASSAAPAISAASTIVVHLLDADDIVVARTAATSGIDRFADRTSWTRLATGEPVFTGVRAWLRCAVVNRMEAGGSTVIAAHALQSHVNRDIEAGTVGNALVYHNRVWHRLGEHSALD
ncbi:flavin reductase family protein [Microbacterium sp. RD1]|uniref:flavin reductase family protein n=1 Tax=Microbacterium sp. RD1 TaxID=3457313 RepID=UPI003FA5800C